MNNVVQNYPLVLRNEKPLFVLIMALVMDSIQCQLHEDHYRLQYYEALNRTIAGIKNRFIQPGYIIYKSVENLLLNVANCNASFEEHFMQLMDLYKYDFDSF